MAQTPEAWFKSLPPITKTYFTAAVATTLLVTLGMLSPSVINLDFTLAFKKFQLWRLITCFIFFGPFSMPFVFNVFILARYFQLLEGGYFPDARGLADMTFLMLFGASTMIAFSYFWGGLVFMGPSMIFMVMYIWSRKDPYRQVTFWGFAFQAWHFPFVMLLVTMLLGGSPVLGMLGICVGHLYHFLVDIIPRVHSIHILKTPEFIYQIFDKSNVHARHSGWQRGAGYRLSD